MQWSVLYEGARGAVGKRSQLLQLPAPSKGGQDGWRRSDRELMDASSEHTACLSAVASGLAHLPLIDGMSGPCPCSTITMHTSSSKQHEVLQAARDSASSVWLWWGRPCEATRLCEDLGGVGGGVHPADMTWRPVAGEYRGTCWVEAATTSRMVAAPASASSSAAPYSTSGPAAARAHCHRRPRKAMNTAQHIIGTAPQDDRMPPDHPLLSYVLQHFAI